MRLAVVAKASAAATIAAALGITGAAMRSSMRNG